MTKLTDLIAILRTRLKSVGHFTNTHWCFSHLISSLSDVGVFHQWHDSHTDFTKNWLISVHTVDILHESEQRRASKRWVTMNR